VKYGVTQTLYTPNNFFLYIRGYEEDTVYKKEKPVYDRRGDIYLGWREAARVIGYISED